MIEKNTHLHQYHVVCRQVGIFFYIQLIVVTISYFAYSKEPRKELFKFIDDPLLFLFPIATAEAGHGRHQLIDIGACGLDLTIPEGG